jgi:hypothetical protein
METPQRQVSTSHDAPPPSQTYTTMTPYTPRIPLHMATVQPNMPRVPATSTPAQKVWPTLTEMAPSKSLNRQDRLTTYYHPLVQSPKQRTEMLQRRTDVRGDFSFESDDEGITVIREQSGKF